MIFLGMEDSEDIMSDGLRIKSLVNGGVIRTLIYVLSLEVEVSELSVSYTHLTLPTTSRV